MVGAQLDNGCMSDIVVVVVAVVVVVVVSSHLLFSVPEHKQRGKSVSCRSTYGLCVRKYLPVCQVGTETTRRHRTTTPS